MLKTTGTLQREEQSYIDKPVSSPFDVDPDPIPVPIRNWVDSGLHGGEISMSRLIHDNSLPNLASSISAAKAQ